MLYRGLARALTHVRAGQEQKRQEELERLCAANLEKQKTGKAGSKESFPSRAELADVATVRDAQRKQVCCLLVLLVLPPRAAASCFLLSPSCNHQGRLVRHVLGAHVSGPAKIAA